MVDDTPDRPGPPPQPSQPAAGEDFWARRFSDIPAEAPPEPEWEPDEEPMPSAEEPALSEERDPVAAAPPSPAAESVRVADWVRNFQRPEESEPEEVPPAEEREPVAAPLRAPAAESVRVPDWVRNFQRPQQPEPGEVQPVAERPPLEPVPAAAANGLEPETAEVPDWVRNFQRRQAPPTRPTEWSSFGPAAIAATAAAGTAPRPLARALPTIRLRSVVEIIEVLALALLMFIAVRSIAQNFVVDGGSMEPTFFNGEMLIVNKLAYRDFDTSWLPWSNNENWRPFGTPKVGDVVVFRFPQNPSRDFIKRVVALPGQTVEIRNGVLRVDGVVRDEPYLTQPPAYEYGPTTVPPGNLFVLGDNRNNSYDSHSWGMLEQKYLIGRAELRYWPLDRAGRIGHDRPGDAEVPAGVSRSP